MSLEVSDVLVEGVAGLDAEPVGFERGEVYSVFGDEFGEEVCWIHVFISDFDLEVEVGFEFACA